MSTIDFMFSRRQQAMLRAMIVHAEKSYGTNELIAIGGPGTGAGRRALEAFDRSGIVVKRSRGNQVLYSINTLSPIFAELRSICMKTFGLADVVAKELEPFSDYIKLAFLFGSIVSGSERPDSDVDLMIISEMTAFDFAEPIERMEKSFRRSLHLCLYTPEEWQLHAEDRVVSAIVNGQKIIVIES